jgi:hypothetical protein
MRAVLGGVEVAGSPNVTGLLRTKYPDFGRASISR